ncbi:sodium:solute symporter family protein [Halococcus sp. AFM35]|uniref:sodium:solute symporter family protein n=1 Tax=Halococcus sp. AFM35 TaxID=3421653 RepID=UPI003EBB18C4
MVNTPLQIVPPETVDIIRENFPIILVTVGLYVVGFLLTSHFARKKSTGDLVDFSVASRTLGWVVVTFTLVASVSSGVGMAGFPGTVYTVGAGFITSVILGFCLASILIWYLGRRIWILGNEYGFSTPGELLGEYYQSDTVRLYTVFISVVFSVAYIVAQFTAGGILIFVLSGGLLSVEIGILLITGIVSLHVIFTGVRGIAWFDTFNGAVQIIAFIAFSAGIILHAGGLQELFVRISETNPDLLTIPGPVGAYPPTNVYGTGIGLLVGLSLMAPAAWFRFYGSNKKENFASIAIGLLVLFLIIDMSLLLMGLYGKIIFPDIANPDFVSSFLAFEILPIPIAVLFLVGILAAIVSTSDSYMHAFSVTFGKDFVRAILVEDMDDDKELNLNYVLILGLAAIATSAALFYEGLIVPLAVFAAGFTVQLLPLTFGAVAWPRASNEAAILAPLVGIPLIFVWELGVVANPLAPMGIRGIFLALIINVAIFVGVSYFTKPVPVKKIEQFHGLLHERL